MPLTIKISSTPLAESTAEVIALGVTESPFDKQKALVALDVALKNALLPHAEHLKFKGAIGQVVDVPTLGHLPSKRVVLVGLGKRRTLAPADLRVLAATAGRAANGVASLSLLLPDKGNPASLRAVGEGVGLGAYRFIKYFTGKRRPEGALENVELHKDGPTNAAELKLVKLGLALAESVALARDAVNEPPNELTPEGLAAIARDIAKAGKLKLKVLDKPGILAAGMKLHYAVGQGSANEPRFNHLSYVPKKAKQKLVFVGKGITFDSGGISLKPGAGMEEMKFDMCGGAGVLGAFVAAVELKLPLNIVCIVPAVENMPDGNAYRPSDILTSMSGLTIEVLNTDAEGRLILCDALTYAQKFEPEVIIDAATLTGACVVALGKHASGLMTKDDELAEQLLKSGNDTMDRAWRLPLWDDYQQQLESGFADVANIGGKYAGAITAGCFLSRFVNGCRWAHLDIAGTAWEEGRKGLATGRPVSLLTQYLIDRAA
jgi:leucyl aminopeptidase